LVFDPSTKGETIPSRQGLPHEHETTKEAPAVKKKFSKMLRIHGTIFLNITYKALPPKIATLLWLCTVHMLGFICGKWFWYTLRRVVKEEFFWGRVGLNSCQYQ